MSSGDDRASLTDEEVHHVLSNSRRRETLERLYENGGTMSTQELADQIATAESGESPPPSDKRRSVYVSLHQNHLPKLDNLGITEYDTQSKTVTLRDGADQVTVYMEAVEPYGLSWGELYAGLGVLGVLLVLGSDLGVPVLAALPPHYWAYLVFGAAIVAGGYRVRQQGESIPSRLRD